jgi:hypothetical protein
MAKGLAAGVALVLIVLGVAAYVYFRAPEGANLPVNGAERVTDRAESAGKTRPADALASQKPDRAQAAGRADAKTQNSDADPVATAADESDPTTSTTATDVLPQGSGDAPTLTIRERPLFDGWQDPALVLLLTGEQHGYVEPCGCSLHQLGGFSRRADLIRQLNERGWTTTGFDVGGLVNNPARKQGKLKFEMMVKCLTDMKYAGVAMGVEELQLTFDFLSYHRSDELPFLGTNLVFFDDPNFTGAPLPKRVVTVGNVKLGVLAVFGPELDEQARPNGPDPGGFEYKILPTVETIRTHLAQIQSEKPELLILLSHSKYKASLELAAAFPEFDIVVSAGGVEDPDPKPKYVGDKTLFVAPGQKGKHVPVVGFFPGKAKDQFKYELVDLDEKRFTDSPKIVENMRFYQDEILKDRNLVANEPAIDDPRNFDPLAGAAIEAQVNPYVGVLACAECHKSAYEVWKDTPHAKATETLKTGRDHLPDYISRTYDPECIACHVTGWDAKKVIRYNTGYTGNENPPDLLTGQQCENCHGPGGKHTELERLLAKNGGKDVKKEEVEAWRKFHQLSVKTAFDLCTRCHDGDNDPNFKTENYDEHWERIAHPGKN